MDKLAFFNDLNFTVRQAPVTPDECSARYMLHCDPEVGWVS